MNAKSSFTRACPICSSDSWEIVLPLAPTPLGDRLTETRARACALPKYALDLALCKQCGHAFLPLAVSPEESYNDYFFETSDSPGLSDSMKRLAEQLWQEVTKSKPRYVLDIGSNDGTWLRHFKNFGNKVLGIEPSPRHAHVASESGIETVNDYFSTSSAVKIAEKYGAPSLITANFVTANVPDLNDFFQAIANLSDNETTIAILTGYHPDQFRVNMFDFIYHEHVSYFTCQDFINLGEKYGLVLVDAQRIGLKGGSLRAVFRKQTAHSSINGDVGRLAQFENWLNVRSANWFSDVHKQIKRAQQQTHNLLDQVGATRIVGYGVSHSVTTLIYQFGLDKRIEVLTDDNPRRQKKFAPGSGLSVINPQKITEDGFDTVIIMAWQHDALIIKRLKEIGFSGSIVQPLPRAALTERKS
jgi:SAM-dependent methyltransferase